MIWIKLGDGNTKFFHNYAKSRQSGKGIPCLTREDGTKCTTQAELKAEVRSFYVNLMGTTADELPMVDKEVIARGYLLGRNKT